MFKDSSGMSEKVGSGMVVMGAVAGKALLEATPAIGAIVIGGSIDGYRDLKKDVAVSYTLFSLVTLLLVVWIGWDAITGYGNYENHEIAMLLVGLFAANSFWSIARHVEKLRKFNRSLAAGYAGAWFWSSLVVAAGVYFFHGLVLPLSQIKPEIVFIAGVLLFNILPKIAFACAKIGVGTKLVYNYMKDEHGFVAKTSEEHNEILKAWDILEKKIGAPSIWMISPLNLITLPLAFTLVV